MIDKYGDFKDKSKLTDKIFLESLSIPYLEFEFEGEKLHYEFLEFGMMANDFVWKYHTENPKEKNGTQFSHYIELNIKVYFDSENKMVVIIELFSLQQKYYNYNFKEPNIIEEIQKPRIAFTEETENDIELLIERISSGRIKIDDMPGESTID